MRDTLLRFEYLDGAFYRSLVLVLISVGLIWRGIHNLLRSFIVCYTATYGGEWSNQKKANLRKAGVVLSLAITITIFWVSVDRWFFGSLLLLVPYLIFSQVQPRGRSRSLVSGSADEVAFEQKRGRFDFDLYVILSILSFWLLIVALVHFSGGLIIMSAVVSLVAWEGWRFVVNGYFRYIDPQGYDYKRFWLKNSIMHIVAFSLTYAAGVIAIIFSYELFVLLVLSLTLVGVYYLLAWLWSKFWGLLFDWAIEKRIKFILAILTEICIVGGLILLFLSEIETWTQEWDWLEAMESFRSKELIDEY